MAVESPTASPTESLGASQTAPPPEETRDAEQHFAWLTKNVTARREKPYHFLLLLRFLLTNILGFSLLAVAYAHGLIDMVLVADKTYLSALIFGVFLCGLAACTREIWRTSSEINEVKSFDPLRPSRAAKYLAQLRGSKGDTRGILASTLRITLSQRVVIVRQVAGSLVLLGLIGTVIGFIIALSGVQAEQATDVKAITPMISTLISGMSTALYTTLVGSVLNVWLMVNYQVLAGGTVKLITGLLEFGEENART